MTTTDDDLDFCAVPLADLRDEGPLVTAAGYLHAAADAGWVGQCGPHVVVPRLFNLRFAVELAVHGCTQALGEGRDCDITLAKTHDLRDLFNHWVRQLADSSTMRRDDAEEAQQMTWAMLKVFHDLDPGGLCLRYPAHLPADADACTLVLQARNAILRLVQETLPLVPETKTSCRRRLHFLVSAAMSPLDCLGDPTKFEWTEWWGDLDPLVVGEIIGDGSFYPR